MFEVWPKELEEELRAARQEHRIRAEETDGYESALRYVRRVLGEALGVPLDAGVAASDLAQQAAQALQRVAPPSTAEVELASLRLALARALEVSDDASDGDLVECVRDVSQDLHAAQRSLGLVAEVLAAIKAPGSTFELRLGSVLGGWR